MYHEFDFRKSILHLTEKHKFNSRQEKHTVVIIAEGLQGKWTVTLSILLLLSQNQFHLELHVFFSVSVLFEIVLKDGSVLLKTSMDTHNA